MLGFLLHLTLNSTITKTTGGLEELTDLKCRGILYK